MILSLLCYLYFLEVTEAYSDLRSVTRGLFLMIDNTTVLWIN